MHDCTISCNPCINAGSVPSLIDAISEVGFLNCCPVGNKSTGFNPDLDFFELFSVEDVVIASKNSVNYNMNSLSMQQALNVVKQKLSRIDLSSMASP